MTITRDFYLTRTEVTEAQYQAVMGSNPARDQECGDCPVESVSWLEAVRYANRLSESEGIEPCYEIAGEAVSWPRGLACGGYRLPTEAEWEYAARAGTTDRYSGTDDSRGVCRYGNIFDEYFKCDDGHSRLAPVASLEPNALGLYDMTGNVREWVWDWFGEYDREATDPIGPASGQYRVYRGGSFGVIPQDARVAYRGYDEPSDRYSDLGFRVARSLP